MKKKNLIKPNASNNELQGKKLKEKQNSTSAGTQAEREIKNTRE